MLEYEESKSKRTGRSLIEADAKSDKSEEKMLSIDKELNLDR